MQKWYLVLLLSLVFYCVKSLPVELGTLEYDNLDVDLDSLSYEAEGKPLNDYFKLLNDHSGHNIDENDETKTKTGLTGYKRKNTANKGIKNNHKIQDLQKLYKVAGTHDQGTFGDQDMYALFEGVAAQAVGIKGKEDRTYRKGTKTRGFHRVHHKDEYKKDKVIYEDDETSGTIKKVGAKGLGYKTGAVARFDQGRFHNDRSKGGYGKQGYLDKGLSQKEVFYSDDHEFDGSFSR